MLKRIREMLSQKASFGVYIMGIFILFALGASSVTKIISNESANSKIIFVDSTLKQVPIKNFKGIEDSQYARMKEINFSVALDPELPSMELISLYGSDGAIYFASSDGRYLFDGNIVNTELDYSVSERELSKVRFSGYEDNTLSHKDRSQEPHKQKESINNSKSESTVMNFDLDAYESAIKERLASIKTASPSRAPNQQASSSSMQPPNRNQNDSHALSDECLITFGGFNQPKIGYNDKCLRLSSDDTQEQVKTLINSFPKEFFVRYEAEDERAEIYVFTDYTCPHCARLHDNIDGFLSNGISVNYIFYPRAIGIPGQDAMAEEVVTNMSSAWCSEDTLDATNTLFEKRSVPYASCNKNDSKLDSPIRQHYILGLMFEIEGTPLIVGSNGKTTYGFRSVGVTLSRLNM